MWEFKHKAATTVWLPNAQSPLITFSRNFPVDGKVASLLRTCYDPANYLDMWRCRQKSATSRCNGIWETTRHSRNRHNELLPAPPCLIKTDLSRCNGFWPYPRSRIQQLVAKMMVAARPVLLCSLSVNPPITIGLCLLIHVRCLCRVIAE